MTANRWLTVAEAAVRVGVSQSTVRRYISRDGLALRLGRVSEEKLLEAERNARTRESAGLSAGGARRDKLKEAAEAFMSTRALAPVEKSTLLEFVDFAKSRQPLRGRA